jgi:hypothetical protein
MTVDEATDRCRQKIGDDAATRLSAFGPVVNTALYAPFEPTEQAAEAAWQAEISLRSLLNEHSSTRRRLLAALDPRTLVNVRGDGST